MDIVVGTLSPINKNKNMPKITDPCRIVNHNMS